MVGAITLLPGTKEFEKIIADIERKYTHIEVIDCPHMDTSRYAPVICKCDYPKRRIEAMRILGVTENICFAGEPCPVRALGLR